MNKEKREILGHLVEYLQQKIDSGEHKIFFNDLMWDEKTIDCINAINNTLEEIEDLKKQIEILVKDDESNQQTIIKQSEEIERLNNIIKEVRENINKKLNVNSDYVDYDFGTELLRQELLEILDKENR